MGVSDCTAENRLRASRGLVDRIHGYGVQFGLERPWEPTLAAARREAVLSIAHRD